MNSIVLFYKKGIHDKVYKIKIEPCGNNLYLVNFSFGRRGNSMQRGTKTTFPVSFYRAVQIFNDIVEEKKRKGYSEQRFVNLISSGYEWTCPNCETTNHEEAILSEVRCENCEMRFETIAYHEGVKRGKEE